MSSGHCAVHFGCCVAIALGLFSCLISGHGFFGGFGGFGGYGGHSIYSQRLIGGHNKFLIHSIINKTALCLIKGGTCETNPAACVTGIVKFNCDAGSLCCFNTTLKQLILVTKLFGKGRRKKKRRRFGYGHGWK